MEKAEVAHHLKTLALKAEHTLYHARSTYIAMKGYLHHLQGSPKEALHELWDAEDTLKQDHLTNFSRHALLIYGNYAWIYYHLANYEMVELYLGRIHEICRSLSSPEPYSAQIPEIHAQKGWSLLALGFRNGEEAKKCFQMALRGDESNQDFQAGLAISVFASWAHAQRSDLWKEAVRLMEKTLHAQPQNCDAKVYLAILLQKTDEQRAKSLVEEVVQGSLDPEVLRKAAKVCEPSSLSRAISVLQHGLTLAPSYHLLHCDLGVCYKKQAEEAPPEEKEEILAAAVKSFKRAVEMDPQSVSPKLELAKIYREKAPLYTEEIYQNLLEEPQRVSKRGQQAIYLHWGDLLLYKKGLRQEALEMYEAGLAIPSGHEKERQQLRGRLEALAQMCEEDSERDLADAVHEILHLQPKSEK
ncbi:interferon-induced protein with tetratricopeptide repeats 5-like [Eublepharis macularius]|uniref:Interferon-induced protein with tetratricopeptide repeats 5-like n=1 Tax=Eublepharis macularius TaxID=481883 RepID=A0AA97JXA5_EUBMA|nr:interferon-induced protein with tetratricopeptide repeats 5-like [Eublepharis macularius]